VEHEADGSELHGQVRAVSLSTYQGQIKALRSRDFLAHFFGLSKKWVAEGMRKEKREQTAKHRSIHSHTPH